MHMSSLIISSLITNTIHFYHISQKNSELVEDDTIRSGEVESGDDGLERSESPKLNFIQKILGSARMGGISGPLVRVSIPE